MALLATTCLVIGGLGTPSASAEEGGHSAAGHKHIALFAGAGSEETPTKSHEAKALGLEFEYRLSDRWGIGATLESLDVHHRGNVVVVVPFSYHFGGGFRAFAGPGYELKQQERNDKGLLRIGIGYEIHLNERWTLAPEALVDILEGDGDTWLVGLALGYGF
jgi:hypothetical protein